MYVREGNEYLGVGCNCLNGGATKQRQYLGLPSLTEEKELVWEH